MKTTSWMSALAACALASLTGGCGESVVQAGGEGGDGGSSTGTGSGAMGGFGGSGASGANGGGGQGGCAAYQDEEGSAQVAVRFRNDSGVPIYLPANCGVLHYELVAAGGDMVTYAFDPFCLQTCEDLQTEGIVDCAACEPSTLLLPVGGTYDVVWDGTGLHPTDMPDSCWFMPGQQNGCGQVVAAEPGSYRIMAMGYDSCGNGDCQCDAYGVCSGDAMGLEAYADSVLFDFPSAALVEVVFGVCAFPCPSGS